MMGAMDFVEQIARGGDWRIATERDAREFAQFVEGKCLSEEKEIRTGAPDKSCLRSPQKGAAIRVHAEAVDDHGIEIEGTCAMQVVNLIACCVIDTFTKMDEKRLVNWSSALFLRKFGIHRHRVCPPIRAKHANGESIGE